MILPLLLLLPLSVSAFSPPSTQGEIPAQKPIPKSVFKGAVYDNEGKAVARAKVFSGLDSAVTEQSGHFRMEIAVPDTGGIFPAVIKADGYVTKWVSVKLVPGDSTVHDCELVSTTYWIFMEVRFKPKSLRIESPGRIEEVFRLLKDCPEVSIEIQGHCFEWTSQQRNLRISQIRAEVVRTEILKRGPIDPARIAAKGYGSSQRVLFDLRPAPRKFNTRIEMHVLS